MRHCSGDFRHGNYREPEVRCFQVKPSRRLFQFTDCEKHNLRKLKEQLANIG
jgi:hypothetical protein